MTDMERRATEIQSILQSLSDRQPVGGESVGAILQWKGTVEEDDIAIDVDAEFIAKWFYNVESGRDIWMLACEHNGELAPIEYTTETEGDFNFSDRASASIKIVADSETGAQSILMNGKDWEDNPIDVKLYSIF